VFKCDLWSEDYNVKTFVGGYVCPSVCLREWILIRIFGALKTSNNSILVIPERNNSENMVL
jgi:hypothetical protein